MDEIFENNQYQILRGYHDMTIFCSEQGPVCTAMYDEDQGGLIFRFDQETINEKEALDLIEFLQKILKSKEKYDKGCNYH